MSHEYPLVELEFKIFNNKKLHRSQVISKLVVAKLDDNCAASAQLHDKFRKKLQDMQGFRQK